MYVNVNCGSKCVFKCDVFRGRRDAYIQELYPKQAKSTSPEKWIDVVAETPEVEYDGITYFVETNDGLTDDGELLYTVETFGDLEETNDARATAKYSKDFTVEYNGYGIPTGTRHYGTTKQKLYYKKVYSDGYCPCTYRYSFTGYDKIRTTYSAYKFHVDKNSVSFSNTSTVGKSSKAIMTTHWSGTSTTASQKKTSTASLKANYNG